ncbi:anaerobic magnesium-protoporphyrin IX monomethyl ester cyclase [Candidatus Magnetomoraceae bacterium gMMP-15]
MKIQLVLATSPITISERYGDFSSAASTEPSFGIACLASVAQKSGAKVSIIESSAQNLTMEQTFKKIININPHIVGISATTAGIVAAGKLAQKIKKFRKEIICVIGGCHVTALPEDTLKEFPNFDLAVLGEGERTLEELVFFFQKQNTIPENLDGTAVRIEDDIKVNKPRLLIKNLDSLPLPAWSLIPGFPHAYRPSPARIKRWPCASIVLTRGCPNKCVFCDRSVFGSFCRGYSTEYSIKMIKDLRYRFGVKELLIEDDTFIINRNKVKAFCEKIINEEIDITWSCLGRADRVNADLLKLMKKAGCWHISYGIESGDPVILKRMKKKINIQQIKDALYQSKKAGLRTKGFFIIGFPFENEHSLKLTRNLSKALPLDDISIMQLTPFPGSELYHIAKSCGTFEQDWKKMNTLNTVFIPYGFSKSDIEKARSRMLREFYLRPEKCFDLFVHIIKNPRLILPILKILPDFIRIILKEKK